MAQPTSKGKADILDGLVDFAGTDAPLTDSEAARKPLVQFPTVAGAVVPAFNIPGVNYLVLDGDVLGKIFAGAIGNWDDPAIARLNPRLRLPNLPIIVVHRSDGSGTTNIFTTYLTKVSKDWTDKVNPSKGTAVTWPVDTLGRGLSGQGNQGVADLVRTTKGAIGYVELATALRSHLLYAYMINAAGRVVDASPATTTVAMKDAVFDDRLAADIQNSKQTTAWPISGFTYMLVPKDIADCAKARSLLQWINWGIGSYEGKLQATRLRYAVLPAALLSRVNVVLKRITCNNGRP